MVLYFAFYLLISPFFAASLPGWTQDYLVEDAIGVGYANLAKMSDSPLVEDLMDSVPGGVDLPADLEVEDFDAVFTLVLPDGNNVGVLRLTEDFPLDDLLPPKTNTAMERVTNTAKYRGIEYATVRTARGSFGYREFFAAKTDATTYCIADDEDALKEVIARFDDRDDESIELNEELQELVSYVGGEDLYFASLIKGPLAAAIALAEEVDGMPQFGRIDAFGIGLSTNSRTLSVTGLAKFGRERDARRWKEDFDSAVEDFAELVEDAPKSEQAQMEAAIDLVKVARVKQRDDTTYFSGKWSVSEIQNVIDEM